MTLCVDIESSVIDAVGESVIEVFDMMAGEKIEPIGQRFLAGSNKPDLPIPDAITIMMGFSGDLQGSLCLSMPTPTAIRWAELLIQHEATEIDQTVIDAASELANILVGGAKRRLGNFQLTMSLPSAVRAGDTSLMFPSNVTPVQVNYQFSGYDLSVIVALVRKL